MKLIYTLILLLFSSSVFADFVDVKGSISDLLDYGFQVEQIDTVGYATYVYHLRGDYGHSGGTTEYTDVAICYIMTIHTYCMIDTQDKSIIEHFNYLELLNKEILNDVEEKIKRSAEEM